MTKSTTHWVAKK